MADDQAGAIEVRGPNGLKGYRRLPEKTAEELRDDGFVSGDMGVFDWEGYLSILGRAKDLVIRGGAECLSGGGRSGA
jgi:malonyl-CoA/methylmalonyl-CoA synthetase